jgi:hypothetical protein
VRDELWTMAINKTKPGSMTQVWTARCPQGYRWRSVGHTERELIDVEGITLAHLPGRPKRRVRALAKD